ncbi:hypothetical protein BDR07DRAFT_1416339 [Suillus spraguei]|nr:hypothetical protein BDR07DRAFT_1416339 [Suillus spraguei]
MYNPCLMSFLCVLLLFFVVGFSFYRLFSAKFCISHCIPPSSQFFSEFCASFCNRCSQRCIICLQLRVGAIL